MQPLHFYFLMLILIINKKKKMEVFFFGFFYKNTIICNKNYFNINFKQFIEVFELDIRLNNKNLGLTHFILGQ